MKVGCVIIGRNEAERLPGALASVARETFASVYIDSGSHDDSVAIARANATPVLLLDPARPFTAARARNEGLAALLSIDPSLSFVMFLDGDCCLASGFIATAMQAMDVDPLCAVVVGHLAEVTVAPSIYSTLSALEWSTSAGEITDFGNLGGIMFARVADIRAIGGFNDKMIAGEDSELGVRLALVGRRVIKVDAPMASHRGDIVRFGQWWRRSVRAGQALAHRFRLHGRSRLQDCRRAYISTILWGGVLPVVGLALAPLTRGLSLLVLAAYGMLMMRLTTYYRQRGARLAGALIAAAFGIAAKFANFVGLLRFHFHELRGRTMLVEYK